MRRKQAKLLLFRGACISFTKILQTKPWWGEEARECVWERGIGLGMLGQYVTVVTKGFPSTRTFSHVFMLHVLVSYVACGGKFSTSWSLDDIFFLICTVIIRLRYIIIPGSTRKIYILSYLRIFFLDVFYKFNIFYIFFSEKNKKKIKDDLCVN